MILPLLHYIYLQSSATATLIRNGWWDGGGVSERGIRVERPYYNINYAGRGNNIMAERFVCVAAATCNTRDGRRL